MKLISVSLCLNLSPCSVGIYVGSNSYLTTCINPLNARPDSISLLWNIIREHFQSVFVDFFESHRHYIHLNSKTELSAFSFLNPDPLLTVANLLLNLILTTAPTDNLDTKTIGQYISQKNILCFNVRSLKECRVII